MIWLTWRRFRIQAAVIYGAVIVLVALFAATGPRLVHLHRVHGNAFLDEVGGADSTLYVVGSLFVLLLPALIGMFWGAPLVSRELDAGTHRLVWTQTTRTRWLVTQLSLIGLAAMVASGLLGLALSHWARPIDMAVDARNGMPGPGIFVFARMSREMFDSRGIVPIGYAAFAFVLGVTLGAVLRRTLPAMAVLLAVFTAAQITMSMAVRPHLLPTERLTTTITHENLTMIGMRGYLTVVIDRPGAWVISQHTVDSAGRAVHPPSWVMSCPSESASDRGSQACFARLNRLGYRQLVTYQPAGRFWALQAYETATYLVLALVLAGASTWWIRHRLS